MDSWISGGDKPKRFVTINGFYPPDRSFGNPTLPLIQESIHPTSEGGEFGKCFP